MRVVLIIWDGLRPDFIQQGLTPALCALSDRGTTFSRHTAIFPTETRVNSASIATGVYPDQHGIVANRFLDRPSNLMVNTGDHLQLRHLEEHSGAILPVPTMCGRLRKKGYKSLVVGSGSPGSTLLQDPRDQDRFVNVRCLVRPESDSSPFEEKYGGFPLESDTPDPWNDLACKVFSDGLKSNEFEFGVLWLCDPDFTQHKHGLGVRASLSAIRQNDGRLAKLIRDLSDGVDLIVASDHGFSTIDQAASPRDGWMWLDADAYEMGSSGIYLNDASRDLERSVSVLMSQDWVGPVFLKEGLDETLGSIPGTYNQNILRINHPERSPDIVYSRRWNDHANTHGIRGMVLGAGGGATHGSLSPHDRRSVLIAAGPSFKGGQTSPVQTSAVDIAPTILRLFGQKADLDGRVLKEGLIGGPSYNDIPVHEITVSDGNATILKCVEIEGKNYFDGIII